MAQNGKQLLCERVRNSQSTNDIIQLLRFIPLEAIEDAIVDAIRDLDTNTVNEIQYKCLSMTDILPDDITQHILSFSDSLNMKYINKAFNNGYNKNRALQLKQRQHIIAKHEFNPIVRYEEHNTTWVIHPTRTHLNSQEIANGYKGPLNKLKDVNDAVRSGDKLLFYDGNYIETKLCEFDMFAREHQLVGMGDNVFLKTNNIFGIELSHNVTLYVKNMKMEFRDSLIICDDASVYLEDCEIVFGSYCFVDVNNTGTFHARNCVFSRPSGLYSGSIRMEYGSNVNIVGCTFTNHKHACIWLHDDEKLLKDIDPYEGTFLKCIGNIFTNNFGYPIAVDKSVSDKFTEILTSVLSHNILEGYNGVNANDTVNTANKIYNIE
eukprot:641881_1